MSKNNNAVEGFLSIVCSLAVVVGFFALLSVLTREKASDCTSEQQYNSTAHKCVSIYNNVSDLADEIAAEATEAAETEKNRRNGTECIPASEAYKYIGVTGCVQLGVLTANHTSYGYAWLDSETSDSSTEFMVFAKNNVLTAADTNYYYGRIIQVRGTIESYKGKAQIEITSKSAITDIESIADRQQRALDAVNEAHSNAACEQYERMKKICQSTSVISCSSISSLKQGCE